MKSILSLLDVFKKLADMGVAQCILTHARLRPQTIRRRSRRCYSRQGLARDRNQRCRGYRCRYGHRVRN
jgi:hypothetical protein